MKIHLLQPPSISFPPTPVGSHVRFWLSGRFEKIDKRGVAIVRVLDHGDRCRHCGKPI